MSEESLVALMIGRPLQLAFPDRHDREERTRRAAPRSRAFGAIGSADKTSRWRAARSSESRVPRATGRCSSSGRSAGAERATGTASCDGKQLDSGSPLGTTPRGGGAAERRPRVRIALPRPERPGERHHPGAAAARTPWARSVADVSGGRSTISCGASAFARHRSSRCRRCRAGISRRSRSTRPFLRGDVKVILAEEPTQGVDVAARFDIYDALREKAKEGVATILKSSDPLELAGLCDRVVVMSRGQIVDEIPGDELGERRIVEAIVGSRAGARAQPTTSPEESA